MWAAVGWKRRLIPWAVCVVCLSSLTAAGADTAAPCVANAWLRVCLDAADGRLVSFTDLAVDHEFLGTAENADLWWMDLLPPGTPPITPRDAKRFAWRAGAAANTLELEWDAFAVAAAPELRVRASVRVEQDAPASHWRIAVEGADALQVAAIRFPRIAAVAPQQDETLTVPIWMGQRTERAREMLSSGGSAHRLEWEYPGILSLQCLALYGPDGPGLYLACDDTRRARKTFAVFGDGQGGLGMEISHAPGAGGASAEYALPYAVELAIIEGDWFAAAARYRDGEPSALFGQASRRVNGAVPEWLLRTGAWVWNRGRSENVLDPARVLLERLGMPVSVFWHWWHGCPYDVGFPEYLPPREGAEPFRAAVAAMHDADLRAIVYMNQRLWGMATASWRDKAAERFAVKGPDGAVHPEVYNTFTRSPCASMCMGTAFWRDKYAGIAEEVLCDYRLDGIYMDQACSSLACFDPAHGHLLGGGTYWMEGFQALVGDIRRRAASCGNSSDPHPNPLPRGSGIVLAGEGCGEAWLPHLDLMLSLQVSMERYAAPGDWEPIPFFHAVYHDKAVLYGNYSSLTTPPYDELWPAETAPKEPLALLDRKYARQFFLEQARAFVWGQQPTIANFRPGHFDDRAEEMAYFARLAQARMRALPWLRDGVMLRPPRLDVPEIVFDASRLSIYAGQGEAVKEFSMRHPAALAAAWQAPRDGSVAVALASISADPLDVELRLHGPAYPLPRAGTVLRVDETGQQPVGRFEDGVAVITARLKALDVCVYVLVGDS